MDKIGFFQVIYTKYQTNTNKTRIKKEFIFLEEFTYTNSMQLLELYKMASNRYKQYNNIITLDFDKKYNCYIFNKSRNITLKLDTIKGTLQSGEKITYSLD